MNQLEPSAKVRSASGLARQLSKIRGLVETVEAAGFLTLDEQAKILGLPRSTVWTIRRGSHKASGLSASIINRMLAAPTLPPLVRAKILEYVQEKAAGLYGGSRSQCCRPPFSGQACPSEPIRSLSSGRSSAWLHWARAGPRGFLGDHRAPRTRTNAPSWS